MSSSRPGGTIALGGLLLASTAVRGAAPASEGAAPASEGAAPASESAAPAAPSPASSRTVQLPTDPSVADLRTLAERAWWAPRVPAETPPFPGTTGNSAAACGQCHAEIYAEWQASTHAHAWTDAQFQTELHKDPEVAWICINCHTPAADQQEELVDWSPEQGVRQVRRRDNPAFDATWQQEGISCLTCHWREQGIAAVHEDVAAPHPTVVDPGLRQADLCLSCHQAAVRLEDALVCHFTTGQEWEQGIADQVVPDQPCQDCHMPFVERSVAPGAPVRQTRRHAWPGALIPKGTAQAEAMAAVGVVPAGTEGALPWAPGVQLLVERPDAPVAGEVVQAAVSVRNLRAGHRVPTGDPERYLLLKVEVETDDGRIIAGGTARYGQRWSWWPVARKLADERIPPGEARRLAVPFVLPAEGATVRATLEHFRISPENAAYHGLVAYPQSRRVEAVEQRITPVEALPEGG